MAATITMAMTQMITVGADMVSSSRRPSQRHSQPRSRAIRAAACRFSADSFMAADDR